MVLAAATAVNLTLGVNYSWSIIKNILVADWHWSNVDASFPYTIYSTVFAVVMVFAGRIQDMIGPRLVVTLGGILVGTGLISCSYVSTLSMMSITYGITGIGYALCFSATMPVCIKWFPDKKGLVTGIVIGASALASAYFSPIVNILAGQYGVQKTFLILGICISIFIVVWAQLLKNPLEGDINRPVAAGRIAAVPVAGLIRKECDWREMIRTRLFYKIYIMYFIAASAGLMIIGHIASIAITQANWENGYYLITIFAISNTVGRLLAGYLSDKFGRLTILKVVFFFMGSNIILFGTYSTAALLALGTFVVGLSYGAAFAVFPLAAADYYGTRNLGGNYGLLFSAWGFAALLGPLMAAYSVDLTGSYVYAYMFSSVTLFGALIFAFSIARQTKAAKLKQAAWE
jgi:MFS transporter, OFA family, oxalate/formate antiporter